MAQEFHSDFQALSMISSTSETIMSLPENQLTTGTYQNIEPLSDSSRDHPVSYSSVLPESEDYSLPARTVYSVNYSTSNIVFPLDSTSPTPNQTVTYWSMDRSLSPVKQEQPDFLPVAIPPPQMSFLSSPPDLPQSATQATVMPDIYINIPPSYYSHEYPATSPRLPHSNTKISQFIPSASQSPLLKKSSLYLFNHFIHNLGSGMDIVSRYHCAHHLLFDSNADRRGLANFWTYDVPMMALSHKHLLKAILAIASLHHSRTVEQDPQTSPDDLPRHMVYYNDAIHGLAEDIRLGRHLDNLATFATTMIIAFFETMNGELDKWCNHMLGAREIVAGLDLDGVKQRACLIYEMESAPDITLNRDDIEALQSVDLLYCFLHMEIMQSIIGASPLLMPSEFWMSVPSRKGHYPHVYATDELSKLLCRISGWVGLDLKRKEALYGEGIESSQSTSPQIDDSLVEEPMRQWQSLCDQLRELEVEFDHLIRPVEPELQDKIEITPFGPVIQYHSSQGMFLKVNVLMAWIVLSRNKPDIPAYGYVTLRHTAHLTREYADELLRSIPGTLPGNIGQLHGENLDRGAIFRLIVDLSVPIFFAAIQIRDPVQQDWLLNWFRTVHDISGWQTAYTVARGIRKAWDGQKIASQGQDLYSVPPSSMNPQLEQFSYVNSNSPASFSSNTGTPDSRNDSSSAASDDTEDSRNSPYTTAARKTGARVTTAKGIIG